MSNPLDLALPQSPKRSPGPRIALGIDPGTAIVGYAVVAAKGNELQMLTCDVVTTHAGMELARRLQIIYERLSEIIALHKPQ